MLNNMHHSVLFNILPASKIFLFPIYFNYLFLFLLLIIYEPILYYKATENVLVRQPDSSGRSNLHHEDQNWHELREHQSGGGLLLFV